jgi:hypothetical protein
MLREIRPTRRWFAVAFLCASTLAVRAQSDLLQRDVKAAPGHDVRVGIYTNIRTDCTSGPLPAIKLVTPPSHGTVTVKRGTLKATNFKQCLATEVPAFVAFYRGAAEFTGTDEFDLEVSFPGGHKQLQHIKVRVSNNPNGAHGI